MRNSTSADYAATSRYIVGKLEIFFSSTPTIVDRDNQLIDFEVLNELGVAKTSPEHTLASNMINFTLYNEDRKFSPDNPDSPYYGKIVKGVKVIPYLRIGDGNIEWDALGEFYVADWSVADDATQVNVEAYDSIYGFITDDNVVRLPVMRGKVANFFPLLLMGNAFSFIGDAAEATIPYLFARGRRYNTYNSICNSQSWFSNVDRSGILRIGKAPFRTNPVVINDDVQLISATIPPTFIRQYDDVTLSYVMPSMLGNQLLADMSEIDLALSDNTFANVSFTRDNVLSVDNCLINSANYVSVVSLMASSRDMTLIVNARDMAGKADIRVYGSILNLAKLEMPGTGNCLVVSNEFVQDEATAIKLRNKLKPFVNCALPVIELDLRGDVHILVGDRLSVSSSFYKLNFTGIVTSVSYKYEGGFSSHVVLMNTAAIGG